MLGEMFYSFVLAQVFGLTMLVMSVIMVSRITYYRELIQRMDEYSPSILMAGTFGLFFGSFLIVIHNLWVGDPRVVVTLISWFIFIKSLLWLAFPIRMVHLSKKIYAGPFYYIFALVLFVLAIFLITKGFYLYIPDEQLDLFPFN